MKYGLLLLKYTPAGFIGLWCVCGVFGAMEFGGIVPGGAIMYKGDGGTIHCAWNSIYVIRLYCVVAVKCVQPTRRN